MSTRCLKACTSDSDVSTAEPMAKPLPVAAVVRHRAVGVRRERDAERREHAHGADRDAVRARERRAREDAGHEEEGRGQAADHADAHALDHDGRRAGHAAVRDGHGRAEVEGREVLRGLPDDEAAHEADEDAPEDFPANTAVALVRLREEEVADENRGDGEEHRGDDEALLQRPHQRAERALPASSLLLRRDEADAAHGADDAGSAEPDRELHL